MARMTETQRESNLIEHSHENPKKEDMINNPLTRLKIKVEMKNGIKCLESCKWLIMSTSFLFISLLSWDIAGDQEGWEGSYWIPLIGIGILTTLWVLDHLIHPRKLARSNESTQ
jgi:hypothetical protein